MTKKPRITAKIFRKAIVNALNYLRIAWFSIKRNRKATKTPIMKTAQDQEGTLWDVLNDWSGKCSTFVKKQQENGAYI